MIVSRAGGEHLTELPVQAQGPTGKLVPANEFARRILELLAEGARPEPGAGGDPQGQKAAAYRQIPAAAPATALAAPDLDPVTIEPERWDEVFDWRASAEEYWNRQPEEVRQLRGIEDPAEREALAAQLTQNGYAIDVPIMVWGWDPLRVMLSRRLFGYTWVPSALQPPVTVAPGIELPGLPAYDAARPPEGSIAVDLSFARLRAGAPT